jgi:hypothetical protein
MSLTERTDAIEPATAIAPVETRTELADLRTAVLGLDDLRAKLTAAGDWPNLAIGLAQVRDLAAQLATIAHDVERDLAELMPSRREEVAGLVLERRMSRKRSEWDWDQLLPRLIRLTLDPEGTGHIPPPMAAVEAMRGLIVETIGVTPSRGPRVTQLRAMGLDPDEWCHSVPNKATVQITGSVD